MKSRFCSLHDAITCIIKKEGFLHLSLIQNSLPVCIVLHILRLEFSTEWIYEHIPSQASGGEISTAVSFVIWLCSDPEDKKKLAGKGIRWTIMLFWVPENMGLLRRVELPKTVKSSACHWKQPPFSAVLSYNLSSASESFAPEILSNIHENPGYVHILLHDFLKIRKFSK